jgi:hypothetical protein
LISKHLIEDSNGFMTYWDIKRKLKRILGLEVSEKTVAKHGKKILGMNGIFLIKFNHING